MNLAGRYKNDQNRIEIREGSRWLIGEFNEVEQVGDTKVRFKLQLAPDCVLKQTELAATKSDSDEKIFKLLNPSRKPGEALEIAPCGEATCNDPILSQKVVLEPDSSSQPSVDEPKPVKSCENITLLGKWEERLQPTGSGCGGEPTHTVEILAGSNDSRFKELETRTSNGYVLYIQRFQNETVLNRKTCVLKVRTVSARETGGTKDRAIPEALKTYSVKILGYSEEPLRRMFRIADCTDAACTKVDLSSVAIFDQQPPPSH
jgi:hypothetical protein